MTVFTCLYSDFGFILKAYMSTQKSEIIVLNFRPDNRAKDYKALGVLAQELKGRPITEGNEHLGTCCLEIRDLTQGYF